MLGHAGPHAGQQPAHGLGPVSGGELEAGDLIGVIDQPQTVTGPHEQRRRVDRLTAQRAQLGDQVGGHLDPVRGALAVGRAEVLPARQADPPGQPGRGQDLAQRLRLRPGLVHQAQALAQDHLDLGRHHRGVGQALVADQQRGRAARHQQQQRLLEPGVEAGQVGQVGEVLPVGVHHQGVQPGGARRARRRRQAALVGRLRQRRLGLGQPEVGQPDLGQLDARAHRHAPAGASGPGWAAGASQSTSPAASLREPTSTVAPRCSTPGWRDSRHSMYP